MERTDGGFWDNNNVFTPGTGVDSLANFLVQFPDAVIVADSSDNGGLRLDTGYSSPGDNYDTYVDNVTVGTANGTTTYDFEPNAATPEPSTIFLLGGGLVAGVVARRRRSRKHA